MSLMPWQLSYAATADLENSELQTDVMRFMAILALCLVAIFAIVQSIPLQPEQALPMATAEPPVQPVVSPPQVTRRVETDAPAPAPRFVTTTERAIETPPPPVSARRAPAAAPPLPEPRRVIRPDPEPVPVARTPRARQRPLPVPAPEPVTADIPARQGLSLRFESDSVLRSLVERRLVSLFAIDGRDFLQMSVAGGRIDFASGPAPAQYHQMVHETVPGEVTRAFHLQRGIEPGAVTWGVTLPAATTRQLQRFVQTNFEGSLVITAEAGLALAGR